MDPVLHNIDNIDFITFHLDQFTYEDIMYDLSKINRDKANQCKWWTVCLTNLFYLFIFFFIFLTVIFKKKLKLQACIFEIRSC